MANNFISERRGEYVLVLVDPGKVRGTLRPDRDYDQGVWTSTDVPPAAIIGVEAIDEGFFESTEFLTHMGIDDDDDGGGEEDGQA
jgi:hypothetical protein